MVLRQRSSQSRRLKASLVAEMAVARCREPAPTRSTHSEEEEEGKTRGLVWELKVALVGLVTELELVAPEKEMAAPPGEESQSGETRVE